MEVEWDLLTGASHFIVYFELIDSNTNSSSMRIFSGNTTEGIIEGLDPDLDYLFFISASFIIHGIIYEGEKTQSMEPGNISCILAPTVVSSTFSVSERSSMSLLKLIVYPSKFFRCYHNSSNHFIRYYILS